MSNTPRILLYDIETSPLHGYAWRKYDDNLLAITRYSEVLTTSWKMLDDSKVHSLVRKDLYAKVNGDKALCRSMSELMEDVDMVVGHNIDGFDAPTLNARFAIHGINPPPNVAVVDTLKIARKYFKFPGNSLNDLAQYLDIGQKHKTDKGLWLRCMEHDPKAFQEMRKYNEQDVVLLEKVFKKLVKFAQNIPNLNLLNPGAKHGEKCPNPVCLSSNVAKNGFHVTPKGRMQKFWCNECGHRFKVAVPKKGAARPKGSSAGASLRLVKNK